MRLSVAHNNLRDPPREVLKEGIGAILEYVGKFHEASVGQTLEVSGMDLRMVPPEVNYSLSHITELDLSSNLLAKID